MSSIAFNTKGREPVYLRGSERAYMGILTSDIAASVVGRSIGRGYNSFVNIMPPLERVNYQYLMEGQSGQSWLSIYLSAIQDHKLFFNGREHHAFDVAANTVIAMESNVMSLLMKINGTCETHGWFDPDDLRYFADIMERGLHDHILREDQNWEQVIEMFRDDIYEPVVMSFSVTDGFPNPYVAGVDTSEDEAWYELSHEEQWDQAMAGLRKDPYLQITPDNLSAQGFESGMSLWDAMASPEWKGETSGS